MPTYGILLYFSFVEPHLMSRLPDAARYGLFAITFLFTFVLPLIAVFFLYRIKVVTSFHVENSQERRWPFLITAACYIGAYYILPNLRELSVIRALILGAALSVVLTLVINLYTKISAHMVGIGGVAGAFLGLSIRLHIPFETVIYSTIAVAGIIGFARLALNAHTPAQVYAGFAVGFFSEMLLFVVLP